MNTTTWAIFLAGLNHYHSIEFSRITHFTPTTCVLRSKQYFSMKLCLFTLTMNQILYNKIPMESLWQIKIIRSRVFFKVLDFLVKFATTAPNSTLQLRSALQITSILICNWSSEEMDKGGISSNNLYYCALYKLLFHHSYRNIWLPASNTSNNVTKIGHVQFSLIFSPERKLIFFPCISCAHIFVLLLQTKLLKIIEKPILMVKNQP